MGARHRTHRRHPRSKLHYLVVGPLRRGWSNAAGGRDFLRNSTNLAVPQITSTAAASSPRGEFETVSLTIDGTRLCSSRAVGVLRSCPSAALDQKGESSGFAIPFEMSCSGRSGSFLTQERTVRSDTGSKPARYGQGTYQQSGHPSGFHPRGDDAARRARAHKEDGAFTRPLTGYPRGGHRGGDHQRSEDREAPGSTPGPAGQFLKRRSVGAKVRDCAQHSARPIAPEALDRVIDFIDHLEDVPDVAVMTALLRGRKTA